MATLALPLSATKKAAIGTYFLTVFAGSFLLFLVQPLIARMALPRLGGAPAVWNSAMLVYQVLLLAGYAYAHWLGRFAPRTQGIVHLAILGAAAMSLPLALAQGVPGPDANIFLWVPRLLLISVGPVFFVVSAQAPLLQRWFTLSSGNDPYPLYAASNFGSFLGLLTYPLVLEPLLSIQAQSLAWTLGYAVLGLLVVACVLKLPQAAPLSRTVTDVPKPRASQIAGWILLSAIPSGLMLSTTLHLTTDIVAMPLLWVLPLGLYLLSYSVAFASSRRAAEAMKRTAPLAILIAGCTVFVDAPNHPLLIAVGALGSLFVVAVAIHAKLFDQRPDAVHLTTFYLATSAGGVLGGLFCALIAPLTFDWTYEHPILLMAAALVTARAVPLARLREMWDGSERHARITRWAIVAAAFLSVTGVAHFSAMFHGTLQYVSAACLFALGIAAAGNRALYLAALMGLMLNLGGWDKIGQSAQGRLTRSFFGIDTVSPFVGNARVLIHGTTAHGFQNLGSPERERMLTSYYAPGSGVAVALAGMPSIFPNARVDVVGLGAGTLSCASRAGQSWRFYEIDPAIADIARHKFSFLSRCQPAAPIVIGDARLTLERQPAHQADVLVLDAFSSDSVPMHLLTREAFEVYRRRLSANGLLMVHISNRYLDLRPVIAAAAARGWSARIRFYQPSKAALARHATPSMWVALSPVPGTIAAVEQQSGPGTWLPLPRERTLAWTDDHASVLPLVKWGG